MSWLDDLNYDAVSPLLASQHTAIEYWARRDLLETEVPQPKEVLWDLRIPHSILKKQLADGSWTYPTTRTSAAMDYDQLETYRQLGFLVEMFGFDRTHPAIEKAAEYIFSKQSTEGDLRGIYANQYSPNYTAALLELLVKSGYQNDPRVLHAFVWLNAMRQDDGGWALPFRTQGRNLDVIYAGSEQLPLVRNKPFSHFATGVILRAYAVHSEYRGTAVAKDAVKLLVSRLFERDVYPDKNHIYDWTRFSFPFWQTDLLSSLHSMSLIDPSLASNDKVLQAKQWFIEHQQDDGLFTGHLLKDRFHDLQLWYSLAVGRVFNRLD